jgi:rare lipoprotein A (peptidoglycan hydrolase)
VSERQTARRRPERALARRPRGSRYGSATGPRPDRVALWAFALGIFLIVVATATAHGATTGGATFDPQGQTGGAAVVGDAASGNVTLADGRSVSGSGLAAVAATMPAQVATWYGPGLYGRRTACGTVLRRGTLGVAHRRLPCGTPVSVYYGGRLVTVPVIDRGPHARGVRWDLTAATARTLGIAQTARVRVLY